VFHFNKKHLEDQTIPMWIIKLKGESYYVDHVDCSVPWSTKETPENSHTKGAIKIKNCLVQIDESNCATIKTLTKTDEIRISNKEKGITRVIVSESNFGGIKLRDTLKTSNIKHGPIKTLGGSCTRIMYITDIFKESDVTYLALVLSETDFRVLKPNEGYYIRYDNDDLDDDYYDDDEDDD
jgi:hypothetical protein